MQSRAHRERRRAKRPCAAYDGWELHAATTVGAGRTGALERLCRYLPCSPVCGDRLRRVLVADVRRCDCGGTRPVVAALLDPDATQAIIAALLLAAPRDPRAG